MHALPWLLICLAVAAVCGWRVAVAQRRAKEMRAAREAAMAVALAEAQKAARESIARKQAEAPARRPVAPVPARDASVSGPSTIAKPAAAHRPHGPAPAARLPQMPAPAAPLPQMPAPAAPLPPAARPAVPPADDARVAARVEAERIALEAARRAKAQRAARAEAERRAALEAESAARAAETAARAAETAARAPKPPAPKSPAETLILLADDSKMVRVKTTRLLEGHAYRVVTAVDGLDALRQLETCHPDLVITDVDMPNLDGFGLARHLRANARTADIPIVMITSAEDRHREDATREGVGLVLGKPYPEDELLAYIRAQA